MAVGISLDPENPPGIEPELPLGHLIQRITQERGSFIKLNEKELEENIVPDDGGVNPDTMEDEVNENIPEDTSAQGESEFSRMRADLMAKVGTALNESALNLDFVSLLVSASRPQAGESSMSPMLKSQIPPSSFNADTITQPAPTIPPHSGYGWKINAYNGSAQHLSRSCSDLSRQVKLEAQFWRDMLYTTTENGEVMNRKLQIKYGYMDSGSNFTGGGHGFGTLRKRDSDGHAIFEPRNPVSPELVQVSVFADSDTTGLDEGRTESDAMDIEESKSETPYADTPTADRLIGRSVIPFDFALENLQEPLRSIRYERNWLFEHELMQQITHEARTSLASHSVKLVGGERVVCSAFGVRIIIELVSPDSFETGGSSNSGDDKSRDPTNPKGKLNYADAINYGLHLLLVDWYKHNFQKIHAKPDLTSQNVKVKRNNKGKDVPKETPPILGAVLARIQHSILVSRAIRLVQVMLPTAQVSTQSDSNQTLKSAPFTNVTINHNDRALALEIRSPITMGDNPPIMGKMDGITPTKIFDLTELETWLKWISK